MAIERILKGTRRVAALTAGSEVLASPFQFLVTGEDNLRVRSWCSQAGVRLAIDMRFALPDGTVQAFADSHVPHSDRSVQMSDIRLTSGYVLNLVVRAVAGAPLVGQCYVTVDVIRGSGTAAVVLGQMLGGYISTSQGLSWPGSPIRSSLEGPGFPTTGFVGTPGGVSNPTDTVPAGARWLITSLYTEYNGIFAVPYSLALWLFSSSAVVFAMVPALATFAGPGVQTLTAGRGYPWATTGAGQFNLAPLPVDQVLIAGAFLQVVQNNFIAGDIFQNWFLNVNEWLEAA